MGRVQDIKIFEKSFFKAHMKRQLWLPLIVDTEAKKLFAWAFDAHGVLEKLCNIVSARTSSNFHQF